MPLFKSSATYAPFHAANLQEAIMRAVDELAKESNGVCKLVSAERDGGQDGQEAACLASITKNPTEAEKALTADGREPTAGEKVELQESERQRTEKRRFVVRPHNY